ncbi:GGDEF domain-containing protein [Pseudoalteromonas sp. J010]|uniref:GGDEF domain-containing protein n=1 Tax=Pseudoalteromonas sp. J010 TaxID=998465 RepID=UPI000F654817|nr:GGDEF domain-containing protein [Pseudoalteromonas sp. J010]RRS10321.1 GGDEF domain-containing protein [Pseudoalteromonas sp. J010]
MMFHDPMAVAQEKMTQVCLFLEQHHLPPTPLNYQVAYTYISATNKPLNETLAKAIKSNTKIDCVLIEQLYYQFLDPGQKVQSELLEGVDSLVTELHENTESSQKHIIRFAQQVSQCIHNLDEHNIQKSKRALSTLTKQTELLLKQHKLFKQALIKARQDYERNQQLLLDLRKHHLLDPQTGLYKRHYLHQKVALWQSQQKSVCALSIQVDNLDAFSTRFGDVVSEVVLNRVANNIKRYVVESGLPGRTGKKEFTIILADVDLDTASVIAEKVRKGVERLKFVSTKGKMPLPNVSLALGIAQLAPEHDFNILAKRASFAAQKAQSLGQHCYISH